MVFNVVTKTPTL